MRLHAYGLCLSKFGWLFRIGSAPHPPSAMNAAPSHKHSFVCTSCADGAQHAMELAKGACLPYSRTQLPTSRQRVSATQSPKVNWIVKSLNTCMASCGDMAFNNALRARYWIGKHLTGKGLQGTRGGTRSLGHIPGAQLVVGGGVPVRALTQLLSLALGGLHIKQRTLQLACHHLWSNSNCSTHNDIADQICAGDGYPQGNFSNVTQVLLFS